MADRDRRHLFVPDSAQPESYQRRRQKIPPIEYPRRSRREHGRRLRRELNAAAQEGQARREAIEVRRLDDGVAVGYSKSAAHHF